MKSEFPGVRVHTEGTRVVALYGKPMSSGRTPEQAVNRFMARHLDAFGIENLTLTERFRSESASGKFTTFAYDQRLGGLPVENGIGRILVHHGVEYRVSYASGLFVDAPVGGFEQDRFTGQQAMSSVRSLDENGRLTQWTEPELVVFAGEYDLNLEEPVRAWKFRGDSSDLTNPRAYTFFVDAATGDLVHARNEIYTVDVSGTVDGMATPGTQPDQAGNPPVSTPIENIRVQIQGGNSVFTNPDGTYTIPNGGTGAVTVEVDMIGEWVEVFTSQGSVIHLEQTVTPPGPADFTLNATPTQFDTAQVNAFFHTTGVHNFMTDRWSLTILDSTLPANVNQTSTCNAFYNGSSINFFAEGGGCVNTAFSDVVYHEYGHHIVNRLGLAQGAFGEGYGDSVALMALDHFILGEDFLGPGSFVRDYRPGSADVVAPCPGSGVHFCGEQLGGTSTKIRENIKATEGAGAGLTTAQQLFVDFSAITLGGNGVDAVSDRMLTEWLTVDDDDADLDNGTPHRTEICDAFAAHGIVCDPLPDLIFTYPNGIPTQLQPGVATVVRVDVADGSTGNAVPGTGTVSVQVNGGGFSTSAMNEIAPNMYEATLPASACLDQLDFFVSADSSTMGTIDDDTNSAVVFTGLNQIFSDDFETDTGWTVVNENLTDGPWERATPLNNGRLDPPADSDGSGNCFLTDNDPATTNSDVDGGPTRLISPVFDLSGTDAMISFDRWFANDDGDDTFVIEVSNNGGSSWTNVNTLTGGQEGWVSDSFQVSAFVAPTANVQVRFSVTDNPNNSITEAGIDAFSIEEFECDDPTDQPDLEVTGIQIDYDPATGGQQGGPGAIGQAADVLVSVRNDGNLPIISANIRTDASVPGGASANANTIINDWDAAPGVQNLAPGGTATVIVSYAAGQLDRCGTYTVIADHDAVNLESESMGGGSTFGDVDGSNDSTTDNTALELDFGTIAGTVAAQSVIIEDPATERVRLNIDYMGLGPGSDSTNVRFLVDLTDLSGTPIHLGVFNRTRDGVPSDGSRSLQIRFSVADLVPPPAPGTEFMIRMRLNDRDSSENCIESFATNTVTIQ